jgi:hypothetical protein
MLISALLARATAVAKAAAVSPPPGDDRYARPISQLSPSLKPSVNLIPTTSTVLNADRTTAESSVGGSSRMEDSRPAQELPAMNVTAVADPAWKKYLPYIIGALVLLLLIVAMKKKNA